ncbi:thiamine pyrophosphate-binding protein [Pseudovibrio sp. SPO723]|uniref:thiamine pyrophosphate-binding protein n=1 Tax=Nesiotobacter zosterae TaxID=392721 RepID=UPI0029C13394|nr:thiamine pyrophosphate-binding protein [Pseudovibrio sp. SPO723]MDX5592246.1 thiamine pyrophosphate-binding protein [Pseudovibrio sp. SPO723]
MRGAEVIAHKLAAAGCKFAFGIPGGEVLALMDGLDKAGIRFALVKHENAGGFMAEGAWHALANQGHDAPVVLLATLGPGVANAVNTVANAFQDRVPLVFLTGRVDGAEAETYTHQVFDHQAMLRPIVKASFRAEPGALNAMMDKALAVAMSGQPGPVHIDVPISVAEKEQDETLEPTRIPLPAPSIPTPAALGEVAQIIANARQPVAIAGVDAVNAHAAPEIQALCAKLQVPLITSYKGKGLIDEASENSWGGAGLSPKADEVLLPALKAADVVLLLGYDPIEMRVNWRMPWNDAAHCIDISPVLRDHGMHRVTHSLVGDVKATIAALTDVLEPQRKWSSEALLATKAKLSTLFAAEAEGWGPASVFHGLRKALPASTVATADSGAHRILVSQIWESPLPRRMLQSSALCTMACALPLGAGYKFASPTTPVVVFVGDAGLEMGLGELSTLRDQKIPVIICVLVDRSLALIELKQRNTQRPNLGVDFEETDFPAIAKAYGGHGVWVADTQSLEREAKAALGRDTFTILACRVDRRAYDGKI